MFKLNKFKTIYIFSLCVILLTWGFTVYATKANYTFEVNIPGISSIQNVDNFGDLVNAIIRIAYRLAMLFALYKLIEVGFKYMTSKGNADVVATVSKGMKNVLIGIAILFGSYIILFTINPNLTKMPKNISCSTGSEFCDEKTKGISPVTVKCTIPKTRYDEEMTEGMSGAQESTEGQGISSNSIQSYVNINTKSFYKSGDWYNALVDLKSGQTSASIWAAIKKLIDDKEIWLPDWCYDELEFGPIKTGHEKQGEYVSCHDSYEAIDLVLRDEDGDALSETAIECMKIALSYLKNASNVTICDETMFKPPHIHIQDKNCTVPCRTE